LSPVAATLADWGSFSAWLVLAEAFTWAGFALLLKAITRPEKPAWKIATALAGGIVSAQVVVVGRYLTLEMLIGCSVGLVAGGLLAFGDRRRLARLVFLLLFTGFCLAETVAAPHGQLHPFNWVPFRGHMLNTTHGIASLLESIGVCAALAWALRLATTASAQRGMAWLGGALAVAAALALELAQRRVPGRAGDVTVPLLFAFTWLAVWRAQPRDVIAMPPQPRSRVRMGAVPQHAATQTVRNALLHYGIAWIVLGAGIWLVTHLPGVPYNVRELLYAGHPWRSAFLLSAALCLTIALPAWLSCWSLQRMRWSFVWPAALVVNAFLVWTLVVNAVPSESIHDIVGAPVLGWPAQTESCLRFVSLHTAVALLISGGIAVALMPFHPARWRFALQWSASAMVLAPLLHWVIVTEAATDNLTELMRDGGSYRASALLGIAAVLTFASGSAIAAFLAYGRRRLLAFGLCIASTVAAYALYRAGTETVIVKYGQIFSAMQFLLSADRSHYAVGAELFVRYAIAYASLAAAVALLQQRAWKFMAAYVTVRQ